jgi:hypothetical protein
MFSSGLSSPTAPSNVTRAFPAAAVREIGRAAAHDGRILASFRPRPLNRRVQVVSPGLAAVRVVRAGFRHRPDRLTVSRKPGLAYCAVTPARNEEDNLRRLAAAMLVQHVRPVAWSSSRTVRGRDPRHRPRARASHPWVRVLRTQPSDGYDRTSAYMNAFHGGVDALDGAGDVVVKLDADVSFEADYFAVWSRLSSKTLAWECQRHAVSRSGAARGARLCCSEITAGAHACLPAIVPRRRVAAGRQHRLLRHRRDPRAPGWVSARRTLRQLPFRHHRPEGAREGEWPGGNGPGRGAQLTTPGTDSRTASLEPPIGR